MGNSPIRGVVAAVVTPIGDDLEPDLDRFVAFCRHLLDNGCDGLNICGTTGEATSFTVAQRTRIMEAAARSLPLDRLMVGTGAAAVGDAVALTSRAAALGFPVALVLPPFYYKGVSDDGLFAFFARLVEATAGQPIPVYLYNFPQMTGLTFSPALARRLKEAFPDRIAGAKDSSGDLAYAAELAKIDGFDAFPSSETALARVDADGFAGCISASVSVTAPLVGRFWRDRGNAALAQQVAAARSAISSVPLIPSVKYLVGRIHDDPEFERLLPPHLPLTQAQKQALDGVGREAA
jgi:4-hydroxy-tetrahydrodipicolinate synthase